MSYIVGSKEPIMPVRDLTRTKRAPETRGAGKVSVAAWPTKTSPTWFACVFSMPATERVEIAKRGVPAQSIAQLAEATGEPKEYVIALLGLSRATVGRKARARR